MDTLYKKVLHTKDLITMLSPLVVRTVFSNRYDVSSLVLKAVFFSNGYDAELISSKIIK